MTTKYYKYEDDDDLVGNGMRYVEADEGIARREVTVIDDLTIGSNIKYPRWGLVLAEGTCDYDDIPEVHKIDRAEFESIWRRHLHSNAGRWALTKAAYEIGDHVTGYLQVFFPQGVIIDLGDSVLGVAEYHACRASTVPANMSTGHRVTARVTGYDEQHQWLMLGTPQVHPERRETAW